MTYSTILLIIILVLSYLTHNVQGMYIRGLSLLLLYEHVVVVCVFVFTCTINCQAVVYSTALLPTIRFRTDWREML